MNDGTKISSDSKNKQPTDNNIESDNLLCPHCGKICFPKEKRVRVNKTMLDTTRKLYRYSYFFYECRNCGYGSPKSKIDFAAALELFERRVTLRS